MSTINALLDKAKNKTGSDAKTAKALGVPFQTVSNWRHGHKGAQPEDHALVASLAGLDPEEALIRAVLEKHANKPKGERLLSVLGNVLLRTGAVATSLSFASAVLVTTLAPRDALATMCRKVKRLATIPGLSSA